MSAMLVLVIVVLAVAADAIRLAVKRRRNKSRVAGAPVTPFVRANPPRGFFLDGGHTWIRLTDAGELRVGVDELLSQALGGADRVELPRLGTKVRRGEPLAVLWRQGRKLAIASPVEGTIVTSNDGLDTMPGDVFTDPYGSGWLTSLWPTDHRQALNVFTLGEAGQRWMEREIHRFSEFLAAHGAGGSNLALAADGAHPAVGAALALQDESWSEFQREFASSREA